MGKVLGILISSVLFFLLFSFLGLTPKAYSAHQSGFFSGLAHGFIAIPSIVMKLITGNQVVFAGNNSGLGYWVGCFIGFFCLGGVGFLGSRRDK